MADSEEKENQEQIGIPQDARESIGNSSFLIYGATAILCVKNEKLPPLLLL